MRLPEEKERIELPVIPADLPKPSPGRNLTDEQKIEVAKFVCSLYATDQWSIKYCLKVVGIKSESTWFKWVGEIEEIKALYQNAGREKDQIYVSSLKVRGRTALEKFVSGHKVRLETIQYQIEIDDDGNEKRTPITATVKEVYIRPNAQAIAFVLTNLDSRNFEKNPERIPEQADRRNIPRTAWLEGDEPSD